MKRFGSVLGLTLCLSACSVGPIGGAASRQIDDATAGNAIKSRMLRAEGDFKDVDVDVVNGLALLTGRVPSDADKALAERIALSAPKVVEVANELVVGGEGRKLLGANDQRISAALRAKLLTDSQVKNSRIDIETRDGVVYLLGRVATPGEAERVAQHASLIGGVTRVVSYLRVDGDARDRSATPADIEESPL